MSLSYFCVSLFRLVLVWYWHWWQGLWKFYSIKDFNIIKTFLKEKKLLYHDIYRYRDIRFSSYRPPLIRKIRPFLSEQAAQLLVQTLVLSILDYCNALLAGLPACTIKPLQLIQNAAARVVFNELKKAHVTPLFIRLHWLPIAARIKFKVLMFAYKTTTGTAPLYLNLLVQTYVPSRSLRKWTTPCVAIPKRYQITLTDLFLDCAQLVEWPSDLNSNSWVFSHFQKTSKKTSFSPAPDQLILTLTYSI